MHSFEPGIYSAEKQPDIVVTYGGELAGDDKHSGPWVQWRFPWEDKITTTLVFEFRELVTMAGYKLTESKPSEGFKAA